MDMHELLSARPVSVYNEATATEYVRLAEQRRQVFALIGRFRQAIAQPRGRKDAIRVLKELVPRSEVYFSVVESVLDKISAAGAAPHRADHRRILDELESTLERCSGSSAQSATADLVHALDALVMHEATISLRSSPRPSSRP
jgi:hemerythrin